MGVPATIVMPRISTPSKIAATKSYGARVIFSGSTSTEREAVVADIIKETGAILIPPYDHPDIILGQGTLGLEFQDQVEQMVTSRSSPASDKSHPQHQPKCSYAVPSAQDAQMRDSEEDEEALQKRRKALDAIIAPCGGGGMLSGIALSCAGTGIRVFGAEPSFEGGDDCRRGLAAGARVEAVQTLTIADGLRTPVGAWPWRIISDAAMVRGVYAVTEEQIRRALRLVLERVKVVVEPSAVVGLAVALFNEEFRGMVEREAGDEGWDLGVVFSGGNLSIEALGKMFEVGGEGAER
jgi:threonine dehydratase